MRRRFRENEEDNRSEFKQNAIALEKRYAPIVKSQKKMSEDIVKELRDQRANTEYFPMGRTCIVTSEMVRSTLLSGNIWSSEVSAKNVGEQTSIHVMATCPGLAGPHTAILEKPVIGADD